ncbi:MAG: hypothetical protein ACFBWO_01515 [Paracoccaceae bacterium]
MTTLFRPARRLDALVPGRHALAGALAGLVVWGLCLAFAQAPLFHDALPGDIAQSASGAAAFVADAWRWPLLAVEGLSDLPDQNIVFTDSLPLVALFWKLVRPGAFDAALYVNALIALAFVGQGTAGAVAVARLAGHPGAPVATATACGAGLVLAAWPAFQYRLAVEHVALAHHWVLILALVPVLLAAQGRRPAGGLAALAALAALGVLVHPYMAAMTLGLLGTFWAIETVETWPGRGRGTWRGTGRDLGRAGGRLALALLPTIATVGVAGHWTGSAAGGGYGTDLAFNLATPLMPGQFSALVPDWLAFPRMQVDGFAYVGLGGLALAAGVIALARQAPPRQARRARPALWLTLAALGGALAVALSTDVWLGGRRILVYDIASPIEAGLGAFRGLGRFAWIPLYAGLLAALAFLARRWTLTEAAAGRREGLASALRAAPPGVALLAVAALLLVEMHPLAARVMPRVSAFAADAPFARLIAETGKLAMYPPFGCGQPGTDAYHAFQLVAVETGARLTNSVVAGRVAPECPASTRAAVEASLAEGTLAVVAAAPLGTALRLNVEGPRCRERLDVVACLDDWSRVGDLAEAFTPVAPLDLAAMDVLRPVRGEPAAAFLDAGFGAPEAWGVWSLASRSVIALPWPVGDRRLAAVEVDLIGYLPAVRPRQTPRIALEVRAPDDPETRPPDGARAPGPDGWRRVAVAATVLAREGGERATLRLAPGAPLAAPGPARLVIDRVEPLSPKAAGEGDDPRPLGVGVVEVRLEAGRSR